MKETDEISPERRATHALDALIKAAGHHAPLLENNSVRVLDTRVRPGERTPVHAHEWPAAPCGRHPSDHTTSRTSGRPTCTSSRSR